MIEQLLSEIGIETVRPGGNGQLLGVCPDCQTKHLYVNGTSGLWDCKKGCGEGNLFELVRKQTGWQNRQCFELLGKYDLNDSTDAPIKTTHKDISWFTTQLRQPSEGELRRLCEVKQIDYKALRKLGPMAHKTEPIICLPAYDPASNKICGYLRIGKDGQLVTLKSGKQEKYPAIGEHGLLGFSALMKENPGVVLFCEGWRDALAAMDSGFSAVASSGGASTFKDSWLGAFKDRTVYIVMDADEPGKKAAQRAARKIASVAKAVHTVSLPYEITKDHGKDLHDYLVADSGDLWKLMGQSCKHESQADLSGDVIVLQNTDPDTVAKKIDEHCRIKLNIIYRYNSIDRWSLYQGNRYQRIEDENEINILIRKCLLKCLIAVPEEQNDGSVKIKYKSLSKKGSRFIGDVKGFWQALDGVYLRPAQKAPCSLDGRLDTKYVLPLGNGLLDFSSHPYKLHPHSSNFYTFNYLDFDWQGETDSNLWMDFLFEVTCGDEERFILLQQWAGYLLKRSYEHQKFLLCYGDGANGKSVFFDVIGALLGPQNCSAVPLSKFNDPHQLTQSYGKMANITDESSRSLDEEAETALKQFTGGTQITFKRLYQQPYSAYPTAKVMIATNKLPRFVDTSNGIWRRMLLVPFDAVIPEDKQDRHLAEKIKATEMPGVLKWALEGLRSLEEMGGFIEAKASKEALEQYKRDMNPLVVFLEENFEPTNCDLDKVDTKHLRQWYEQWCGDHGYKPKNDTNVGIQIRKLWPQIEKKQLRQGGDRNRYYIKLKLKNDSEFYDEI